LNWVLAALDTVAMSDINHRQFTVLSEGENPIVEYVLPYISCLFAI
jgi:ABC-type Mn2+/Zn2+ transport system ATPase subunit